MYGAGSQCTISTATPIPDNGTETIQFAVTGLVDNNLASPTQGICGVEIEFMHEYVGDLTVTLVSPSGTTVQLIGPPTTAITATNLSNWDIDFIPCMTPASPDPGFADAWSNLQAWQALTPYTGSYHPHAGCLEDFNSGPANGLWQIIIQDHDQFQVGNIESLTLIFCNPSGLSCSTCSPNAGTLSPSQFSICSGENIQSSDITVDFGGNVPLPALYAYEYLLVSGNTILQSGSSFSITPPAGTYSMCGLSYLITDSATVNALIAADDYGDLSQAINNSIICAQLTNTCIALDVNAKPDTMVVTGNLCNGEVFSFGGQDYFTDGFFYQVHDGPGLCDTVFEIRISARDLTVDLNIPDTLSCGIGSISLVSTVSGASGPFTYQWTTMAGNITSSTNGNSVTVDQAGQYFVSVSDGVCEGAGSTIVIADQGFPQVFFEGGTITCTTPVVNLNPIFVPTDGILLWTGPSGFMSAQPNIAVTTPGTYILNVTNTAGCTTSRSVDIGIDTSTFPVDIIEYNKDCPGASLTLGNTAPQFNTNWQWTGPNGFATNYWRPVVTAPGIYSLTVTFLNGCLRTGTYLFDADFTIPDISVPPTDTLNCNEVIPLGIVSGTAGGTYAWNGPLGFFSPTQTIMVNQEGMYTGSIEAPNGCQNSASVVIELGDDIFDFQTFTDTLNCSTSTVSIGVVAPDADIFQWIGYSGPDADQATIEVDAGGTYTVMMTDAGTGCVVSADVVVPTDFSLPSFSFTTDTITCDDPTAELNFVPVAGFSYSSVFWELPDLTVVQGPTLMSGLSGEHRLIAIGANGCMGVRRIHIPFDTIFPFVILETDTLNCSDTVMVISQSLDSVTSYVWNGPGIISLNGEFINVDKPGWYHLTAYGRNGCPAEHDILVDSNYVLPGYALMADSLRCDRLATLQVIPLDPVIRYAWFDAMGMSISTDSSAQVNQPGQYTVEITGANNCIAYDTIVLDSLVFPVVEVSTDTFTCIDFAVEVSAIVDLPQYTIAWVDANGDTLSNVSSFLVMQPGPFTASVSGLNGCLTAESILVPYDTIAPVASIASVGELRCQIRDIMLDGAASSPVPLSYNWTTTGGMIISNPTLSQVDVRDTGRYVLQVISLRNGCIDSDTLQLAEHPDAITSAFLEITLPECTGDDNGAILVTGLQGGVLPLQYQLDSGPLQSSPLFDGLGAGTFLLSVTDAENCVFDTTIVIEPTINFSVDVGPDVEIYLGETTGLIGMTDLVAGDIAFDQWSSNGSALCTDCAMFDVSPLETTTYAYQLTSVTGCTRADELIVYVLERGKYFLANVFSPNGDGVNDEVRLHVSPGIEKILQWIIFDRWGNAVFGKTNFDPADTSVFWNGQTSTGEFVNPGVFPYVLEIQLINGKVEVYHGDITVVR